MHVHDLGTVAGGPEAIFAAARSDKRLKPGIATEKAAEILVEWGAGMAKANLTASTVPAVQALVHETISVFGDRSDDNAEMFDDWLDELVAQKFGAFIEIVGMSWHGDATIDCQVYDEARRNAFCKSFAEAYVEGVFATTDTREPKRGETKISVAKRLSKLGIAIAGDELKGFLASLGEHKAPDPMTLGGAQEIVHSVIHNFCLNFGGWEHTEVGALTELCRQASEDDMAMAISALSVLDPRQEPMAGYEAFQAVAKASPSFETTVMELMTTPVYVAPPEPTAKEKAKAAKKDRVAKPDRDTGDDIIDVEPELLVNMRSIGISDTELGEIFGVSRPTIGNYIKGGKPLKVRRATLSAAGIATERALEAAQALKAQIANFMRIE
jgi:hypothetical protein